jgi:hypothetical protein
VPLVALGLAAPATWLADQLEPRLGSWREFLPAFVVVVAVLDATTASVDRLRGLRLTGEEATYREVGGLVRHSRQTIYLANFYGYPLLYYGELAGSYWPHWFDARLDALLGEAPKTPQQRLAEMNRAHPSRYFIVTNLGEFARQTDLRQLLDENYGVVARTDRYVIYDLHDRLKAPTAD